MVYDAIVIGGSYAGLSAALQLARARRSILVIDAGVRRNRYAASAHGFLGQDGEAPSDIAANARAQLMRYPSVDWVDAKAASAESQPGMFSVALENGERRTAKRLVLATGVSDELPAVPGLAERWGKSVFHCPYCHGYELGGGRIGVLASSPMFMHHALMLPDWGATTLFLNGAFAPDEDQMKQLTRRGVTIEAGLITRIAGDRADVHLEDGRIVSVEGLFTLTRTSMASPIAEQIGCAFDESPFGPFIRTDATKETTTPGVFACGDAARATGSLPLAVGDGTMAGVAAHRSLIFADL